MNYSSMRDKIKCLKEAYPKGTRLELIEMDDKQAPPVGTQGTVRGVDDIGSILMKWNNGSSLSLIDEQCKYTSELYIKIHIIVTVNTLFNLARKKTYLAI